MFDLSTGKNTHFAGYNNGAYRAGSVSGLGTDPNTGVTATDTELNAQVEFYDVAHRTGIAAVQLPCTGDADQYYSGSGIAVDPANKLFLVTETYNACNNGNGGVVVVYDESGNLVETIPGSTFLSANRRPRSILRNGWTGPSAAPAGVAASAILLLSKFASAGKLLKNHVFGSPAGDARPPAGWVNAIFTLKVQNSRGIRPLFPPARQSNMRSKWAWKLPGVLWTSHWTLGMPHRRRPAGKDSRLASG